MGSDFFHHQIFSPVRYSVFRCIAAGPAVRRNNDFRCNSQFSSDRADRCYPTPRMAGLKFWFNWAPGSSSLPAVKWGKWPEIQNGFAWVVYKHPYKSGVMGPYLPLVFRPTWLVILLYSVVLREPHNKGVFFTAISPSFDLRSMYAICYHKNPPKVGNYTSPMDPMRNITCDHNWVHGFSYRCTPPPVNAATTSTVLRG